MVNQNLIAHEEFIGLYLTENVFTASLVAIIEDVLKSMNIKLELCRGQCYESASTMSGAKNGVAKLFATKESQVREETSQHKSYMSVRQAYENNTKCYFIKMDTCFLRTL